MDHAKRIAQFETMVAPTADPTNDMAWFSLGQAYADAARAGETERWQDAARAWTRCLELNPAMSKAYQLAGNALISAGDNARAAELLKKGYIEAGKRGDRMPQKAIADLLAKLGEQPPEVAAGPVEAAVMGTSGFVCKRTGRPGTKMDRPPFRGPVGAWIHDNISKETFHAWIAQGTKVINEMRLDMSRPEHAETYDKYMREYLGIDDELFEKLSAQ
ncbi:MAG: Fe(2+)-trafficking protein [Planctomycetota bacterium]|nr:Fe(2+)-trafficking protein [Planctomycetota bacterium]